MKLNLYLLLFVLILNSSGSIIGQTNISLDVPRIVPVSPSAAAMEKYQSYPVNYLTGLPDITIPLYEIVAKEVSIPVSLSYHASGLKPKEGNSLVGTGWTLNLEPSVTRQVCGAPDEISYGWFNNPSGNYYPYNEESKIKYYGEFVDNKRDTRPDRFSYKLAIGSGSGYFLNKRQFLSIPRNNDKVEYKDADGILITDANGIRYVFNGESEFVRQGFDFGGDIKTRWMCKSIWSPHDTHKALVNFFYTTIANTSPPSRYDGLDNKAILNSSQQGNTIKNIFTVQTTNTNSHYSVQYSPVPGAGGIPNANLVSISESTAGVHYPVISRFIDNNMTIARLNEVSYMGNKMYVYYKAVGDVPNNSTVLDEIEVLDKDGIKVRSIKFFITPYNSYTSLTKLDSIVISAPGSDSHKYVFDYHNGWNVPSIYTKGVDHWGFYNGSGNEGKPTIPSFSREIVLPDVNGGLSNRVMLNFSGAIREPDHEWTKTGVLTKITNPLGSTTEFTYEGNFGAFRDNDKNYFNKDYLHPVGGLRIKCIKTTDPETRKSIYKNYKYGLTRHGIAGFEPVWGGGAIKHIVTIRDYISSIIHRNRDPNTNNVWSESLISFNSMPQSSISFNGGSSVMYNIVTEETTGSDNVVKMKTNYYYDVEIHNFEDVLNWNDSDPSSSVQAFLREKPESVLNQITRVFPAHPYSPSVDYVSHYSSTNQLFGVLKSTEHLKNDSPISSLNYVYKTERVWYNNISVDIPHRRIIGYTEGLNVNDVFVVANYYPPLYSGMVQTTYYLDTENYRVVDKETASNYYDVDGMQDVVTTEKKYAYHFDKTDPGSSLKPRRIEAITSNSSVVIDSLDYLQGFPAILSRHKHIENRSWQESRILFKPNSCLPEKVQLRTDQMTDFQDEIEFKAYDSYGNVTEIAGKDGVPISFIWGYQGQFPVAKIENATLQQVHVVSPSFGNWATYSEPPTEMWSKIEQLKIELPNVRLTKYKYKPLLGVVSITDPNGITTYYDYDGFGRLKCIKDHEGNILQKYEYHYLTQTNQ